MLFLISTKEFNDYNWNSYIILYILEWILTEKSCPISKDLLDNLFYLIIALTLGWSHQNAIIVLKKGSSEKRYQTPPFLFILNNYHHHHYNFVSLSYTEWHSLSLRQLNQILHQILFDSSFLNRTDRIPIPLHNL